MENSRILNKTVLNSQRQRSQKENLKKYLETNENGNTPYHNLWDAAKAILTGTFIMIKAYIEKKEISQVNNLNQLKMDKILKHQICICQPTRREERVKAP